MRVDEFASAEVRLALWKLVSDNVQSAIAAQAEQERRANAEKAARRKPKRGKRSSSPKAATIWHSPKSHRFLLTLSSASSKRASDWTVSKASVSMDYWV